MLDKDLNSEELSRGRSLLFALTVTPPLSYNVSTGSIFYITGNISSKEFIMLDVTIGIICEGTKKGAAFSRYVVEKRRFRSNISSYS